MTSKHYSRDAKGVDILDRCGLPLKGGYNTAIYIVGCSFKSFVQGIFIINVLFTVSVSVLHYQPIRFHLATIVKPHVSFVSVDIRLSKSFLARFL